MIPTITEQALETLRIESGEVFDTDTNQGRVYFRRASAREVEKRLAQSGKGIMAELDANEDLASACALYPAREELRKLGERYPLLWTQISDAITAVAKGQGSRIAPAPQDVFDALEAKHSELFEASSRAQGVALFRRATKAEIQRALSKAEKGAANARSGNEELALSCVVYPERAALEKLFEQCPLLGTEVGNAIISVAQGDESTAAKKP